MVEGVEYRGVTVPVEKLDRHDRRLVRKIVGRPHDGISNMIAEVYKSPEAYDAYRSGHLRDRESLVKRGVSKAKEIFRSIKHKSA